MHAETNLTCGAIALRVGLNRGTVERIMQNAADHKPAPPKE